MTDDTIGNKIKRYVAKVSSLSLKDAEELSALAEDIITNPPFYIARCINKEKIYEYLIAILEQAGMKLTDIWNSDIISPYFLSFRRDRRIIWLESTLFSIWNIVWMNIWERDRDIAGFVKIDETTYRGIYNTTIVLIIDEIIKQVKKRLDNENLSAEQYNSILNNLTNYYSNYVSSNIFLNFKGVDKTTKYEKVKAIKKFIHLTEDGYGILFRTNTHSTARIEIRLPVWNEEDYPVIIDYPQAPVNIQVMVLKEGMFVPEGIWRYPDKLTSKDILYEPDLEIRRMMFNIIGAEEFLKQTDAELIDEKDNLNLYRIPFTIETPIHIIKCICPSTKREYYLCVPPTIDDAKEAIAWTFGETSKTYLPIIET